MTSIKKIVIIILLFSFSFLLLGNNFKKAGTGCCDYNGDSVNDYFIDINKNGINDNDEKMFNVKPTIEGAKLYIEYSKILDTYLKTPTEENLKNYLIILNKMYIFLGIHVGHGRLFRDHNQDGINDKFIDINGDGRNDLFPKCRHMNKRRKRHWNRYFQNKCTTLTPEVLQVEK
ncbi:hypothetical protein KAJ27_09455 [bacterium]|nr:hypothetical protein [bacterium]